MYEEQDRPQRSALQVAAKDVLDELGYVWLGDLSGMEVVPTLDDAGLPRLELRHRVCETRWPQPLDEGISADGANFLANLVERAARARAGHTCTPRQLSPETAAMMERWKAAERVSGSPRLLPTDPEPAPLDNPDEEPPPDPEEPPAGRHQ